MKHVFELDNEGEILLRTLNLAVLTSRGLIKAGDHLCVECIVCGIVFCVECDPHALKSNRCPGYKRQNISLQ